MPLTTLFQSTTKPLVLGDVHARAGFTPATSILTLDGSLPVEWLEAHDRIITRDRGMVRATQIEKWQHTGAIVVVRKGALGPDLPSEDIRLVPSTELLLRQGPTGENLSRMKAADLVDETEIKVEYPRGPITLIGLKFDAPHIVYAGGLEILVKP